MSYHHNHSGQDERDIAFPRFFLDKKENAVKSAEAGMTVFDDVEKVEITTPGSRDKWCGFVNDEHRRRWPGIYEQFKKGQEQTVDGFPLKLWAACTPGQTAMLEQLGCFTVQQLANMPDTALQRIPMGGLALREKAKAYLADAVNGQALSQALAANERLQSELDALKAQVADLAARKKTEA